ncbi:DUF3267 domain-containing protein [Bacillus inaquosorum]|uniref:DUF3267 domain-containing protein n=1 Tax=Bacillus inaquosorum TaxID=483913 RepID=UPI00227DB655|nr:DUF3267 domain-containing protein [Bacillus inaquosorum]MCY9457353.1 metalloprotease family protein [Bacillus inaquosorum]
MKVLTSSFGSMNLITNILEIFWLVIFLLLDMVFSLIRASSPLLIFVYMLGYAISFLLTLRFLTVVHENTHASVASFFSIKTKICYYHKNEKGRKTFKPYCLFEKSDEITKGAFIIIALAPAIVLSLIIITFLFFSKMYLAHYPEVFYFGFIILVLKLWGCSGDLILVIGACKESKGVKFQQTEAGNFKVIKINDA